MSSHRISGERFIIAATLDAVEEGQAFERIPPHMTVVRWFSFPERQRPYLFNAMDQIFTGRDVFQNLEGGRHLKYGENNDIPVREMLHAEAGPHFALRALVKSMGKFADGDEFADVFSAHVTDEPGHVIKRREKVAIPTAALISAHSDEAMQHVVKAYPLGSEHHG